MCWLALGENLKNKKDCKRLSIWAAADVIDWNGPDWQHSEFGSCVLGGYSVGNVDMSVWMCRSSYREELATFSKVEDVFSKI